MDKEAVGRAVRAAREARKFSQVELAKGVGCDQTTVSLVERGKVSTSAALVARIAAFLEVTTDSLLLATAPDSEAAPPA